MDIFEQLGRKTEPFEVGGLSVTIRKLSVDERLRGQKIAKESESEPGRFFSYIVSVACLEFKGKTPEEIQEGIDDDHTIAIANRILSLSGIGAEAEAEKN